MSNNLGSAIPVDLDAVNGQDTFDPAWMIQTDTINPTNYHGVSVANGMIGLVSSPEPLSMKEVVLNGVYDNYGRGRVSNIMKGFNPTHVDLLIDGNRLDRHNIRDHRQQLDMKHACFTNIFTFGDSARVTYTIRSLRQLPFSSLIEIKIEAMKDLEFSAATITEAPNILRDVINNFSVVDRPHTRISLLTSTGKSPSRKHTLAASSSFIFDEESPMVTHEDNDHYRHSARFGKGLQKGQTYTFGILGTQVSTERFETPRNEAERLTIYANLQGRKKLIKHHNKAWNELWESDIRIEGNIEDQRDVRLALYHLYSFAREGTANSLSPMGLSGLGYNGHVFWDTELWMYPPLLMLQPQIAKSLLEYRFERLQAAKDKAFAHGYKGAMFPWESDDTGQEATPVWSLCGPFEHHITAVIGIAFWNYYRVTEDKKWLTEKGYPLLKEVADFWVSRVERDEQGSYDINNVVGADEWAENVNNNAFTNGAVIEVLNSAKSAAEVLGRKPDPKWVEVADNIPIATFKNGVTKEYDSYKGGDIKQADVNLLAYPLKVVSDPEQIKKDVEYYEARIGDGPAMSHSILSVLYSKLGEPQKAYKLFKRSYTPNKVPPFGALAEMAGGSNPYFVTGAGGMLQAVLAGFAGMDISDWGLSQLNTSIPKEWNSLEVIMKGIRLLNK